MGMNGTNDSSYKIGASGASGKTISPGTCLAKKNPRFEGGDLYNKSGDDLLSHTFTRVVPSALEGLTAEFGMGSGVTPPL